MTVREDAAEIIRGSISAVLPGSSVEKALKTLTLSDGKLIVIAVGKAAFPMARAASRFYGSRITAGLLVSKYDHVLKNLYAFEAIEAGHPVPDENSEIAAEKALSMIQGLNNRDTVLFLLSGGASALFEKSAISLEELQSVTDHLLRSGADIREINTIRKHLSYVKGGRFAAACSPAHVHTIVLSDVLGNDLSMIGSGPTALDETTGQDAFSIIEKYHIRLSAVALEALTRETPKHLSNVSYDIVGDVSILCSAAMKIAESLGYSPMLLTDELDCEAKDAGAFFGSIAKTYQNTSESVAFIAGGETVVHVTGDGKGGRNQEMALSCAKSIQGLKNVCFFSVGSDGTDGPTDAAGGIIDGFTWENLKAAGISPDQALSGHNSYEALKAVRSLVLTGPTGTNVNDLSVLLIKRNA